MYFSAALTPWLRQTLILHVVYGKRSIAIYNEIYNGGILLQRAFLEKYILK